MERSCCIRYYGTWLSLLFAFLMDKVSMQGVTVEAVVGDSVILLCSASRYEKDVFWRHENTKTVLDILEGKEDLHDQHAAYKGRLESFQSEFAKGNYSIKLKDVKSTDTGSYSCQTPDIIFVDIELKVTEKTKTEPSVRFLQHRFVQSNGGVRRQSDSLLRFSVAVLGLSVRFCF